MINKQQTKMRSPQNLLEETKNFLEGNQILNDVLWVGSADGNYAMSWEEFAAIADFIYDSGYTWSNNINYGLVVVGNDWWMSRHVGIEGCEFWKLNRYPERSANAQLFNTVRYNAPHDVWWDSKLETDKNQAG